MWICSSAAGRLQQHRRTMVEKPMNLGSSNDVAL
jgi:hypothetical protein